MTADAPALLWGDLHRQTALTCGEGDLGDHVAAAERDGLDFLAVTDNATLTEDPRMRQFVGDRLAEHPHFYPALDAHAISREDWDDLRRFVHGRNGQAPIFLLGYEWCSNRYGDRNVYYRDDGPLHLPPEISELYPTLARAGALSVVHHSGYARGRRGADWNHHDGRSERLVEIFSTQQGSSEGFGDGWPLHSRSMGGMTQEGSVLEALSRRYKLGFTAGTDLHRLDQRPGRTGVFVEARTRDALWEGLWHRRTIATTGPSFRFRFEIDGHGVGSILTTDRLPTVRAELPAEGWTAAELVRNGGIIARWNVREVDVREGARTLRHDESAEGLVPDNYYYLRVRLEGEHLAWSSPVWISILPDAPPFRDVLYWLPEERCFMWGRRTRDGLELFVRNGYVPGAAAGGLVAPEDATLRGARVSVIDPNGVALHVHAIGDLEKGGECRVELPAPAPSHRVRVTFLDPWGNRRHIERGDWLDAGMRPPFQPQPQPS